MSTTIRPATYRDTPALASLLLEACDCDPLHRLLEPGQAKFPQDTHSAVYRGIRDKILSPQWMVDVIVAEGRLVGLAAWDISKRMQGRPVSWSVAPQAFWIWDTAVDWLFGVSRSADLEKQAQYNAAYESLSKRHVSLGTITLAQVAILPDARRKGYGSALLRHRLPEFDHVLVASSLVGEKFYEAHGFVKVGTLEMPGYSENWYTWDTRDKSGRVEAR